MSGELHRFYQEDEMNAWQALLEYEGDVADYNIFDNYDEAIPLCITDEIKENRKTKQTIQDAITKHKPDMILFNNPWWGRMMLSFQLPLICGRSSLLMGV